MPNFDNNSSVYSDDNELGFSKMMVVEEEDDPKADSPSEVRTFEHGNMHFEH